MSFNHHQSLRFQCDGKVASDAEKEAWNYIIKWLTRLRLLDGVPFPYIVPSDGMLPNESIRFFHLDRNWLDALVDGALSTGVLDSRGSLADESAENVKCCTMN